MTPLERRAALLELRVREIYKRTTRKIEAPTGVWHCTVCANESTGSPFVWKTYVPVPKSSLQLCRECDETVARNYLADGPNYLERVTRSRPYAPKPGHFVIEGTCEHKHTGIDAARDCKAGRWIIIERSSDGGDVQLLS